MKQGHGLIYQLSDAYEVGLLIWRSLDVKKNMSEVVKYKQILIRRLSLYKISTAYLRRFH